MTDARAISVAFGDGIGPEIMEATLEILRRAGAQLQIETIQIGEKMYERGHTSGIDSAAWESLYRTKVLLKAPITTPQGGGYKSLNVTMRKQLGLYANVRPTVSYAPYVKTHFPEMNLVVVRENEEDLYAGIEYRQTDDMYQSLKLISRPGSERIVRYAFDYAVKNNRKKVTCFIKDNIMKVSDGIFHKVFKEVAKEYPNIQADSYIVDIGTARIAAKPEIFDVIVTENLYGDIISDVAAEISGSVGLAGSANIGPEVAMFEAIHGSAPDIAGKGLANPSGLLHAAIMMLIHIDQPEVAAKIHNAWLRTLEEGMHTGDIYNAETSKKKLSTMDFAHAVVANLGKKPEHYDAVEYKAVPQRKDALAVRPTVPATKKLVGVDVFVHHHGQDVNALGETVGALAGNGLKLSYIASKGLKVWPNPMEGMQYVDHWCCRFTNPANDEAISHEQISALLQRAAQAGIDFVKTENLYTFDGERGYSLAQGE